MGWHTKFNIIGFREMRTLLQRNEKGYAHDEMEFILNKENTLLGVNLPFQKTKVEREKLFKRINCINMHAVWLFATLSYPQHMFFLLNMFFKKNN